jgi:2-haloacid dehalogenase
VTDTLLKRPDSVAALHKLRSQYVIAPLSNGHVALLIDMAKAAGLPWDAIFGVDIFRHYKPHPETYLGAAALLGCEPSEVMLVASHPSDGLTAAWCQGHDRLLHSAAPGDLHGPGLEPGPFLRMQHALCLSLSKTQIRQY